MGRKTVLVTGCSAGGLGEALAEAFRQAGFHVFATARDPAKISSTLATQLHVEILALDVQSAESIATCVAQVHSKTSGSLDVLVNNAGGGLIRPLLDTSLADAKALYDVNVWGVLAMAQACAPLLIQAKGAMVNISSIGGTNPVPFQGMIVNRPFRESGDLALMHCSGIYNSSKAAVTFLSETLKAELILWRVRVLTAMVGSVKTEIYSKLQVNLPDSSWYQAHRELHGEASPRRATRTYQRACRGHGTQYRIRHRERPSGQDLAWWKGGNGERYVGFFLQRSRNG